jgi:hypothetical protein
MPRKESAVRRRFDGETFDKMHLFESENGIQVSAADDHAQQDHFQHKRRRHMSGFKRNFTAVRKDAAKFVRRRIEKRTHSAGARISEVAKLLRSSVRDVQSRDSPFADDVVASIAQRLDAVGRYLSVSDIDRLLADVESLARRVPLTFTVTGFLLGFSTGRFLRASRDS